jgi:hypothetical protein
VANFRTFGVTLAFLGKCAPFLAEAHGSIEVNVCRFCHSFICSKMGAKTQIKIGPGICRKPAR